MSRRRPQRDGGRVARGIHEPARLGDPPCERVVEREDAFVAERQHRQRGDRFGDRSGAIDRIRVRLFLRLKVDDTKTIGIRELTVDDDPDREARELLLPELFLPDGVDFGERRRELRSAMGVA
jgi:hypothetical protein